MPQMTNVPYQDLKVDRHKKLVDNVLDLYCAWLNVAMEEEGKRYQYVPHTYDKAQFLPGSEYGDTRVAFLREVKHSITYLELVPYDGDDGGPATLYVHAERDYHVEETGRTKQGSYEEYEILGYNTEPDGTNTVAEEPHTVTYEYQETRIVWDDTYTIRSILQEFDTYFSHVYDSEGGLLTERFKTTKS